MGNYGLKVALPGKNITSSEPRDYAFNSAYGTVKIYASGSGTITIGAGSSGSATITHGLPFVPMVMYWCELSPSSGKWFFGAVKYNPSDADAGDCYVETDTYVDSTIFYLDIVNQGGSSKTVSYKYLLFGDTSEA